MKTSSIQIITLEPDDGYVLTNGEVYSNKVYLGKNDSPLNWTEISEELAENRKMNLMEEPS